MSTYPFDDDDYGESGCRKHGRAYCDECEDARLAAIRQQQHEESVKKQRSRLKVLNARTK